MGASAEAFDAASNLRRFVGRSFSSDLTRDARRVYLCAASPAEGLAAVRRAAWIRLIDRSSKCHISNRNNRRLETYLTAAESTCAAVLIATNDDLTNVVVLPNRGRPSPRLGELGGSVQRESTELFPNGDPLFSAPAGVANDFISNSEIRRLETYLTSAKSVQAACLIAKKTTYRRSAFFARFGVFTPMEQLRRSRFRGALALRYPLNLLGPWRICKDGEENVESV